MSSQSALYGGDESRNTEGSGLGLAIARSFTEAQGGTMKLEAEDDLFKVTVRWKEEKMENLPSIGNQWRKPIP